MAPHKRHGQVSRLARTLCPRPGKANVPAALAREPMINARIRRQACSQQCRRQPRANVESARSPGEIANHDGEAPGGMPNGARRAALLHGVPSARQPATRRDRPAPLASCPAEDGP